MTIPNGYSEVNYKALLPDDAPLWHGGEGKITYSYAYEIPDDYSADLQYRIGDYAYAPDTSPTLQQTQMELIEVAVARLNEVANLNLTPAGADLLPGEENNGAIFGSGTMLNIFGGPLGYGEIVLPRTDDAYYEYSIRRVFENGIDFFGTNYSSIYVNTNGSITFGNGVLAYNARSLSHGTTPMIAPFLADIDTRAGGTGATSGRVYLDIDTERDVVTITWDDVNFYDRNGTRQNSFQLQLFDRSNGAGNFDIVFRYENIDWLTGDASNGNNGFGGILPRAGFTAGDGSYFYELPASGRHSPLRALDETPGNTGVTGMWRFNFRNGVVTDGNLTFGALSFDDASVSGVSYNAGEGRIGGDIWLNDDADYGGTNYAWHSVMQNIGRALGLAVPDETLQGAHNSAAFTLMSDRGLPSQQDLDLLQQYFPATPMLYDIQALQSAYGANLSTRLGDDVYFAEGSGTGFEIGDGGNLVATIWDASGEDTFSAEAQTSRAVIDLRPGSFSTIGSVANNVSIALGVRDSGARSAWIENAIGGSAGDVISGNGVSNTLRGGGGGDRIHGGNGDDTIFGDEGDDILRGANGEDTITDGTGRDRLFGGYGDDVFIFVKDDEVDALRDYEDGIDTIVFSGHEGNGFEDMRFVDLSPGVVRIVYDGQFIFITGLGGDLEAADFDAGDFLFQ
ncbi:nidogen-like domain-containing protein [Oceanicella sp. SM1341]|uniref:nidogen-like domain-containing protein n=1 Tax=Oceanicella sp. SM1341 TaxID=1548889 RepID=UPI000E52636B|nr:nidogen-like domain-containing protein [Oceanicella sp. SM1341]